MLNIAILGKCGAGYERPGIWRPPCENIQNLKCVNRYVLCRASKRNTRNRTRGNNVI
jgi:hypothetical protein